MFTPESFTHRHESLESFEKELESLGFQDITGKYYWHPLADKDKLVELLGREPVLEDLDSENSDVKNSFHKIENDTHSSGHGRNNGKEVFYTPDGKIWFRDLSKIDTAEEEVGLIDKLKDCLIDLDVLESKKNNQPLRELREYNDKFVYMSNGEQFFG